MSTEASPADSIFFAVSSSPGHSMRVSGVDSASMERPIDFSIRPKCITMTLTQPSMASNIGPRTVRTPAAKFSITGRVAMNRSPIS